MKFKISKKILIFYILFFIKFDEFLEKKLFYLFNLLILFLFILLIKFKIQ